jgi:hypothetical protein
MEERNLIIAINDPEPGYVMLSIICTSDLQGARIPFSSRSTFKGPSDVFISFLPRRPVNRLANAGRLTLGPCRYCSRSSTAHRDYASQHRSNDFMMSMTTGDVAFPPTSTIAQIGVVRYATRE